jgi:7-carboxy-7-deazaguanine synthase
MRGQRTAGRTVTLPVNEVFATVQGEAAFTGTPATFVRLQGCPVGCPWCDTKHTWDVATAMRRSLAVMQDKSALPTAEYADVSVSDLVTAVEAMQPRHVVLTGGEPCLYDLTALSERLIAGGRRVQVETSGTELVRVAPGAWVTVSPKLGMPGGRALRQDALERANEVKLPIGRLADYAALRPLLATLAPHVLVWLQPLSQSPKATALCVALATAYGHRVSVQVHKYLGVR